MDDEEIFIPAPEDEDKEANEKMQQGKPGNRLYDPYFRDADEALNWKPEEN
jgi:hypothetical protein